MTRNVILKEASKRTTRSKENDTKDTKANGWHT